MQQCQSNAPTPRAPLAALVAGACLLFAGCGGPVEPGPPQPCATSPTYERMPGVRADVDPTVGTIILPVEKYLLSEAERNELSNARALAMKVCAGVQGVEVSWSKLEYIPESDRRYGVWLIAEVERYGYAIPTALASGDEAGNEYTDADLQVFDDCNRTDEDVAAFRYEDVQPSFDYTSELGGITAAAFGSDEGRAVFTDWERCITKVGLVRDAEISPFAIQGASLDATEANIRIAVPDVQCKTQTEFVRRLADLEASMQAPVVEKHESELVEMRAEYEAMLERAREYVAATAP
jgi:hypothetical protein